MKKIYLSFLISLATLFFIGFVMRLTRVQPFEEIGFWVSTVTSFLLTVIAVLICIDSYKKKKQKD